ncbi:MAG: ribosome maturation factor RimP [Acidobacteriota bacterium]
MTSEGTSRVALDRIRALAARVAASRGLDVFDVQFRRESRGWVVRVYLDRPGAPVRPGKAGTTAGDGVTIEDCQRTSEDLGTLLEVEDVIEQRYTLEVSSPGLDRPLRGPDDYRRFAGCLAKVVLSGPVDGQTHVEGRLQGMDGGDVLIADAKGRVRRIPQSRVAHARLEVEF